MMPPRPEFARALPTDSAATGVNQPHGLSVGPRLQDAGFSFEGATLRLSDQIARSLLLGVLFAMPAILCLYAAVVTDPDVWWHLRSAEWIVQHRSLPHTDPFSTIVSTTGAPRPWAAYSWLFEILVLSLFQHLGLAGILAYTTGMVLAITLALHRLLRRLHSDFTFTVLLTSVACLGMWRLDSPRPWHFTILFFVLELDILLQARRTGRRHGLLWLPVLFALWSNLHIQFLDGLLLLGLAVAEALLARWWHAARTRLSLASILPVTLACVLATCCNPYGWGIYRVAHDLAAQSGVMDHIAELQAIPFRIAPDFCILLLALAAAAALARSNRLRIFETAAFTFAAFLSFRSQRDVWLTAVVAGAVIASCLQSPTTQKADQAAPGRARKQPATPPFAWPLTAAVTALLLFAGCRLMHLGNSRFATQLADDLPVHATEYIRTNALPGPIFNDYVWGGYLMWALDRPVSIDGRAALQGDDRIARFGDTWNAAPNWAADPDLTRAALIIGPVKSPLIQLLRLDPHFQLAYEDNLAAVFTRQNSKH